MSSPPEPPSLRRRCQRPVAYDGSCGPSVDDGGVASCRFGRQPGATKLRQVYEAPPGPGAPTGGALEDVGQPRSGGTAALAPSVGASSASRSPEIASARCV